MDGSLLAGWATWDAAYTSEAAYVEVHRTLDRTSREGRLTPQSLLAAEAEVILLADAVKWVPVSREVIDTASGPMPGILKALDAIDIATAMSIRMAGAQDLIFATHDRRQAAAALALGFIVEGG